VAQGKFAEDLYDRLTPFPCESRRLETDGKRLRLSPGMYCQHSEKMRFGVSRSPRRPEVVGELLWRGICENLSGSSSGEPSFQRENRYGTRPFSRDWKRANLFASFLKRVEVKPSESPKQEAPSETNGPPLPIFLSNWSTDQNPLVSIKTFTQLLREKFNDPEYRNIFTDRYRGYRIKLTPFWIGFLTT